MLYCTTFITDDLIEGGIIWRQSFDGSYNQKLILERGRKDFLHAVLDAHITYDRDLAIWATASDEYREKFWLEIPGDKWYATE